MSFLFASSHLPETRVQRPQDEEEEDVQPMLHSGGVRAFSHLQAKEATVDPTGQLSQRGAQAIGRQLQRTEEPKDTSTPHADGISAAKASGVFDVVRQQYNSSGTPHFMDEDGNLRPRDQNRQQDSTFPRDERNPQFGAGTPTRPAWSTGHAAAADSSRSPRAPSSAFDDTRPWYLPPITPEDLDSQHSDDDDEAGSHSSPTGRPEAHDLVYRTPGASTPKPGLNDLLYRYNGSPEEAKDHRRDYIQNVADAADARGRPAQQTQTYGAAPDNRSNAGYASNLGSDNQPSATAPSSPPLTTDDIRDLADKSEFGAAKRLFKARLAEQQRISKEVADSKRVLQANQDNIQSLQNLRETLKWTKKGYDYGRKRLPKHLRDEVDKVMKQTGADPAAQITSLVAMIKESEARTAENKRAIQQAEESYRQALKATQAAAQQMRDLEEQKNRPPVSPPAPTPVPAPSQTPSQQYKLQTQPWT